MPKWSRQKRRNRTGSCGGGKEEEPIPLHSTQLNISNRSAINKNKTPTKRKCKVLLIYQMLYFLVSLIPCEIESRIATKRCIDKMIIFKGMLKTLRMFERISQHPLNADIHNITIRHNSCHSNSLFAPLWQNHQNPFGQNENLSRKCL